MDLHTPEDQRLVNFIDQNVQLDHIKRLDLATNRQTYTVVINSKAQFRNITEFKRGRHAVIDAIKYEFVTGILYTIFFVGFITGLITGIITGLMGANQMLCGSLAGAIGGAITVPIHSVIRDDEETKSSVRLLAMRQFAVILASGLIGASGIASIGVAMGAIGAAFIGSLIAGVLSRKTMKSTTNATIFAISLGGLVGMAIGAVGGTVPGTISSAITAGIVAITFDNLKATFRIILTTGTFSEMIKTVTPGVIMALPREDPYSAGIVIGTILGAILNNFLNYYNIMLGNGAAFRAAISIGVVIATAMHIKHPKDVDPTKIFNSIIIFLTTFNLQVINLVLGDGATVAMCGLIAAAIISIAIILPNNPLFDPFRYKTIFAAIAVYCAAIVVMSAFLPIYIISIIFFTNRVDFPTQTVLVAITGAALGGYLLATLVNVVGLRFIDGAVTRINDQSIALVRRILKKFDVSIILGAEGAVFGIASAFAIVREVAMAAIMGATMGIASGAFATVAMAIIRNITVPAITKMCTTQEIKTIIAITTASAFIGGVCGGYFTSSVVAGILVALAFPVVTMVMYTAPVYAERRHQFKRVNRVSLIRVMNKFGIELRNLTSEETQNNWIRYKIF